MLRGKEAAGEKLEASRGWFMRFKERNHLHTIKVPGEAANAMLDLQQVYPQDPA